MSAQSSSKRAASPIVYDIPKLKRARSHSASLSEGEVTDSDNEALELFSYREREKERDKKERQRLEARRERFGESRDRWSDRYRDQDSDRQRDRDRQLECHKDQEIKIKSKKKETDNLLTSKTGGVCLPPARRRMMQAAITDENSAKYQQEKWEALKKSITGLMNKVNVGNIKEIMYELLAVNIIRGRGLLCRSIIQTQGAFTALTSVYAAVVAIINSKFPQIGELLLKRLILEFMRGYHHSDKNICLSASWFIAHLVNQEVAHELLALEVLTLLLEKATDDSVELAVGFLKECGQKLTEVSPKGINAIFERLRSILHESEVHIRVQYMIEVMFQVKKDKFKDHEAVVDVLMLVEEDDQFTHLLSLDEVTDGEDLLNTFQFDLEFKKNEQQYKEIRNELLADEDRKGSKSSDSDSSKEDEEEAEQTSSKQTETDLVGLRRTIYLTLTLVAERFCMLNKIYVEKFEEMFMAKYETCHRLDATKLRNVSKFFAHLLHTDAISWGVLQVIKMNENDTASSSRIFVKQLFLEIAEYKGLPRLNERLKDETLQGCFEGIMPKDHPKKTRFAINFFTSIGLGGLTDGLKEHLKNMPKPSESSSSSFSGSRSSDSDSGTDSDSSSDSE